MRRMALAVALMGMAAASGPALALTSAVPATPLGVTLQATRGGMIYADANGKTLYTFDKDQAGMSACTGECATARPPLLAAAGAKPSGAWSIVAREGGGNQWVFKGKPVYTFNGDQQPGETKGAADAWRIASFAPLGTLDLPQDIAVREAITLPGQILIDARGFTLYAGPADCAAKCADTWMPLAAAAIAGSIGDFTAVKRADGMRQWAYKGMPLYTFTGDLKAGDIKGQGASDKFQVAALVQYFMPEGVAIRENPDDPIHPMILTTAQGHALYARERWTYTQTFHAKDGDRGTPAHGRAIGTKGCTAECLAKWRPLTALQNAVPSGHWTILTRDDGARQWAYQGYALYAYLEDEKAGDIRGNELFDRWEQDVIGLAPGSVTATASVMYWRVAAP